MSGLVNKVKDALHSDKSSTTTSQPEGTHGHHNTRAANAADPRIDSDRDHRAAHTTTTHGTAGGLHESSTASYGTHEPGYASRGTHEGAYNTLGDNNRGLGGPASKTDGPHKSNLMNQADPRVDSDRDYSRNMGANPDRSAEVGRNTHSTTTGTTHHSNTLGSSAPMSSSTTHNTHNTHTLGSTGPSHHTTTAGSGLSSSGAPEGTYGPHSGRMANAADPRVDSDRDHRGAPGHTFGSTTTSGRTAGTTTGHNVGLENTHASGPAPNTAGPHKSDMLNKADPRVDSDLDGSKTYGGNKTYGA